MFFKTRRHLKAVAEAARAAAKGDIPEASHGAPEPYRSILSDIRDAASLIEKGSQAAVEEKNRVLAMLESMSEGVLAVDTQQRILLVNSALARSFGFGKADAVGRYFWEMFRDPDINEMIQTGLKRRQPERREHPALLSDSVFEIQISPVFTHEEFLGLVAVFRDITSLKEFERLRTEFVANVSHELKTPLTSILGFVETLKEGAHENEEDRLKFLNIIEEQSMKLHAMIEDLLYLSRLETAKEPLKAERVDVNRLFAKMHELFSPQLNDKSILLRSNVPAGLTVQAEASSLERALSNLVDNAVKYNRPSGSIELLADRRGESVHIEVRDTGIGVPSSDLTRIFERFYRADKSRSRASGGTGLGLSIAKHIAERHGGRIDVTSVPDQGSVFSIILPK